MQLMSPRGPCYREKENELLDWCKSRCANFRVPRYLRIVADFEADRKSVV